MGGSHQGDREALRSGKSVSNFRPSSDGCGQTNLCLCLHLRPHLQGSRSSKLTSYFSACERVREHFSQIPKAFVCEAAAAAAVTSAWRRSEGGTAETGASLQCIDQIKEALQLQKGKNMIFFLHIRFVNFLSHKMITLNVFLYSLSITHTHSNFKINNIHNLSLKQSRFFFGVMRPHEQMQLVELPVVTSEGHFSFFTKTNRTTNTWGHTPQQPTPRRDSKDLLLGLSRPLVHSEATASRCRQESSTEAISLK